MVDVRKGIRPEILASNNPNGEDAAIELALLERLLVIIADHQHSVCDSELYPNAAGSVYSFIATLSTSLTVTSIMK